MQVATHIKLLLSSIVMFLTPFSWANAQLNLVQDGGFEDTTSNWTSFQGEGTLKYWHTLDSNAYSSDFAFCNNYFNCIFCLPDPAFFNNLARNGNAACEIILFRDSFFLNGYNRGILRNKLSKKLVENKEYCLTAYARLSIQPLHIYSDALRFYFDNGQLDTMYEKHLDINGIYPFVQPQISAPILTDTSKWLKVQRTFIAGADMSYLTIGNFKTKDSTLKQLPPWHTNFANTCSCQEILLDDISVIPTDLHDWLHDTFCTFGDSVWVGLDQFDYGDGVWYNSNMQVIDTIQGFWYKPELAITSFIQGVDVCGTWHYDTMYVYMYPQSIEQSTDQNVELHVQPNPANESVIISLTKLLNNKDEIIIFDDNGKEVYRKVPHGNFTKINVNQFAAGVYIVRYGKKNTKLQIR
jgi:hypothetical protein